MLIHTLLIEGICSYFVVVLMMAAIVGVGVLLFRIEDRVLMHVNTAASLAPVLHVCVCVRNDSMNIQDTNMLT